MKTLSFDPIRADVAITEKEKSAALHANALLHNGQGAGNDFLGWVGLPSALGEEELQAIETEAARLRDLAEVILCIGIGGSYLGARAVYEALSDPFNLLHEHPAKPILLFAGQNLSEDYLARLLAAVENRSIAAIVISKSGTTPEPAIAFRLIRDEIEHRYGRKEATNFVTSGIGSPCQEVKESVHYMTVPPCNRSRDATEDNLMCNELVYIINIETIVGSFVQTFELFCQRIGNRLFGILIHPCSDCNRNDSNNDTCDSYRRIEMNRIGFSI